MYDYYITFLATEVSSGANQEYLVRTLHRGNNTNGRVRGGAPCAWLEPTATAAMNDPPAAAETEAILGNSRAVLQRE